MRDTSSDEKGTLLGAYYYFSLPLGSSSGAVLVGCLNEAAAADQLHQDRNLCVTEALQVWVFPICL